MAVESPVDYIHQLVASNPVGATDDRNTADDHLRLIKKAILGTFPLITGPLTVTHTELNLNVGAASTLASLSARATKYSLSISAINTRVNTLSVSVSVVQADVARISQTVSVVIADAVRISVTVANLWTAHNATSNSVSVVQADVARISVTVANIWTKVNSLSVDLVNTFSIRKFSYTVATNFATTAATIAYDDTIPQQSSDGGLLMDLVFTPTSATNILHIQASVWVGSNANNTLALILYKDAVEDALAVVSTYEAAAAGTAQMRIDHYMVAGGTGAMTFKIFGATAGVGTLTMNGAAGARLFGTTVKSSMSITEIEA